MDFGRDYTMAVPSRTQSANWGSCIESQLDFKDEEGPGYWTRPPMMREAIVIATRDSIEISWPNSPVTTVIKLGQGASLSYE